MTINDAQQVTDEADEWLPEKCPPWCGQEHAQALVEGNGWRDSQEHI